MSGAAQGPPTTSTEPDPSPRGDFEDDLRSVKRWLAVTAAWALAATAIAVLAFITANEDDQDLERTDRVVLAAARDLGRVNRRLESLENQTETLPSRELVARIEKRLKVVEQANASFDDRLRGLLRLYRALDTRVKALERAPDASGPGADGGEPAP